MGKKTHSKTRKPKSTMAARKNDNQNQTIFNKFNFEKQLSKKKTSFIPVTIMGSDFMCHINNGNTWLSVTSEPPVSIRNIEDEHKLLSCLALIAINKKYDMKGIEDVDVQLGITPKILDFPEGCKTLVSSLCKKGDSQFIGMFSMNKNKEVVMTK